MTSPQLKAVIFDIGGVVAKSPFLAIAEYEREHGIPKDYLNCSIVGRGPVGAWQKFERGEIPLFQFYDEFSTDLSDTINGNKWQGMTWNTHVTGAMYEAYCKRKHMPCPPLPSILKVNGRDLFGRMMRTANEYDPLVVQAIHRIRTARKHKVIALTNNFAKVEIPSSEIEFLGWQEGAVPSYLRNLFDDFCDSSTLGMRKPEPRFYLLACERNGIHPQEAVFLDDIGLNLKAAKMLGMQTIHVPLGDASKAIQELEDKLGIDLTSPAISEIAKL